MPYGGEWDWSPDVRRELQQSGQLAVEVHTMQGGIETVVVAADDYVAPPNGAYC